MFRSAFSAVLVAIQVIQISAVQKAPMPGYGVEDFSWTFRTRQGGPNMTVNGTIQQAVSQPILVNPDWKVDFNFSEPSESLNKRKHHPPIQFPALRFGKPDCHPKAWLWKQCSSRYIIDGINYLQKRPIDDVYDDWNVTFIGGPVAMPGPNMCGRVSCSHKSAIWWCHDKPISFILNRFSDIREGAIEILQACRDQSANAAHNILGQVFHESGDWNVVVREDTDYC